MNSKNKKTLEALFVRPLRTDIKYKDVEVLFRSLGAQIVEGNGSRVKFVLNNRKIILHKPHPHKQLQRYSVEVLCIFFLNLEEYRDVL